MLIVVGRVFFGKNTPSPVQRVEIPKPDGSTRPLGIPTVLDSVIQQAIAQVMNPIFDPHFSESSCGFRPGRSAHDFIILVKSLSAAQRVMTSISRFLKRELRLIVNEKKSSFGKVEECSFLGFVFVRGKIRWSDKAFREFKRRIRLFTGRSWGVSMEYRLHKLAEYVRGWINYYGISEYYRPVPIVDEWLRRRMS